MRLIFPPPFSHALWENLTKLPSLFFPRRQKHTIQSVFLYGKTTCSIKKRIQQVVFLYHSAVSSKGFCWFRQGAFFAIVLTNKPLLPIIRKETPFYANGRKPNVITARRGGPAFRAKFVYSNPMAAFRSRKRGAPPVDRKTVRWGQRGKLGGGRQLKKKKKRKTNKKKKGKNFRSPHKTGRKNCGRNVQGGSG